jgi:hypothetical protein
MRHCPDQYFSTKEVEQFITGQVWETSRVALWRVTDKKHIRIKQKPSKNMEFLND